MLELTPNLLSFRASEALTFDSVLGTIDLRQPTRSRACEVDLSEVLYAAVFGGLDTLVRDSAALAWETSPGKIYTNHTTTDPASGPPSSWPSPPGGVDLDAAFNSFTFDNLDFAAEPHRFFAVVERDSP